MTAEIPIYAIFELELQHVALFILNLRDTSGINEFWHICPSYLDLLLQSCRRYSHGRIHLVDVFRVKYSQHTVVANKRVRTPIPRSAVGSECLVDYQARVTNEPNVRLFPALLPRTSPYSLGKY